MSSSTAPLRYYCHQCDRSVSIPPPPSPDDDVLCPFCDGGFVEELPDAPPPPPTSFFPPSFLSPSSSFDLRNPGDLFSFLGPPSPAAPSQFNASNFLHDHISGLLSGGATIQIVVEGSGLSPSPPPAGLSLGDYFMGSGLEQLIQQLAENDPNRYGTPPAAKSAVAALPDVAVSADIMAVGGGDQCAVCMEDFHLGTAAKQLPCNHVFHKDCILPWLDLHSSCPVCRFELPTDDPAAGGEQHAPASPTTPSPRGAQRRFRISLPLPLGPRRASFASAQAESSDPSSQNDGRNDATLPWSQGPVSAMFAAFRAGNSNPSSQDDGDGDENDTHRGYDDLD